MGRDPRGFDAETLPHASRIPAGQRVLLPRVRVSWEDASGAHEEWIEHDALVGASPSVTLRIEDPLVSRLHAELSIKPDGVWLRDLASKNGSFIEAVRVIEAVVPQGGRVRIGGTVLRFTESWDASPPELSEREALGFLVGTSTAMRELFVRIERVAATSTPVLVIGETGVGKELVAHTIHEHSIFKGGPFVVVDCATASALDIEAARGGTLFLDEVGDLPPSLQPQLLRLLDARDVARIVASTQRDLPKLVAEGTFREDLYFRLAVLPLTVPPLRERLDDLPLLVRALLPPQEHAAITPALLDELRARAWRGNVRELRNFVERALTFGTAEAIELLAPPSESGVASGPPGALPKVRSDEPFKVIRDRWINHLEREYLRGVLARTGGNVSAAAHAAGLDRAYVYRLIRKHDL